MRACKGVTTVVLQMLQRHFFCKNCLIHGKNSPVWKKSRATGETMKNLTKLAGQAIKQMTIAGAFGYAVGYSVAWVILNGAGGVGPENVSITVQPPTRIELSTGGETSRGVEFKGALRQPDTAGPRSRAPVWGIDGGTVVFNEAGNLRSCVRWDATAR